MREKRKVLPKNRTILSHSWECTQKIVNLIKGRMDAFFWPLYRPTHYINIETQRHIIKNISLNIKAHVQVNNADPRSQGLLNKTPRARCGTPS